MDPSDPIHKLACKGHESTYINSSPEGNALLSYMHMASDTLLKHGTSRCNGVGCTSVLLYQKVGIYWLLTERTVCPGVYSKLCCVPQ